ncbi:hypothetical protein SH139x_004229 [Planctomycetaceae bacterium SH139]
MFETRCHLLVSLLIAQLACGLHCVCLAQRVFYDFLRYEPLPDSEVQLLRSVDRVLSITHFPSFQLLGLPDSDIPSMFFCALFGYAVGFSLGFLASRQIVRFRATSFFWWLCMAIVVSDVSMIVILMKDPVTSLFVFLRIQLLLAVPVAAVVGIVFGIAKLERWLQSLGPREP